MVKFMRRATMDKPRCKLLFGETGESRAVNSTLFGSFISVLPQGNQLKPSYMLHFPLKSSLKKGYIQKTPASGANSCLEEGNFQQENGPREKHQSSTSGLPVAGFFVLEGGEGEINITFLRAQS